MAEKIKSITVPSPSGNIVYCLDSKLNSFETKKGIVTIEDECGSDNDGNMWWQYSGYDSKGNRVFGIENCPVIIDYLTEDDEKPY